MDLSSKKLFSHKIKTAQEILDVIGARPRNHKVIMCHGTFDVVHPGHIRHMLYAKTKADILIASLTADQHITKGDMRPYVPEDLRAINLAALEMVDYVLIDHDPTPLKNLGKLKPDFFAKGYEYTAGAINLKTQGEIDVLDSYGGEMIFTPGDIVYSSSALIELSPPSIAIEKLMTLMEGEGITFKDLRNALAVLRDVSVHVVGDTIVDSYTYCSMIGGMTKTPTMSVRYEKKVDYTGGAAVVAKHLCAAGANVTFSTVLGNDEYKNFVLNDLEISGVNCLPIIDETRPTTNKNAIVAETYRLLKVDTLDNRSISEKITERLRKQINDVDAQVVVFSDFRHGIFNRGTIPTLSAAIPNGAYKVADSQVASRWGNILEFEEFDLITPNEREARFALGDQDSVVRPLAGELYRRAKCKTLILKCGARGIIVYRSSKLSFRAFFVVESFADRVVDPVGAGDALLAYSTLAMAVTKNEVISSILGNIAAGVECEHEGNWLVTPDQVLKKIDAIEKIVNYGLPS
ncbi:PfkB family carbohydrate kinase [Polynucleobacter sp. AP-Feld-500C-C5]|uniref:PfkB family carbohydrate kinase n=1 Tax=Polynucleobacter sp. AP-Feld-500C-C5 TaxID=2576924 RepID=UPI001C0C5782|nr:PfkB family carbohydrate kinase [Polynucleobacter sp. AP-Feld-500C-C5]MBU3632866.1 adenylyltransferase/cytidyltransferase family protein [Polynucleobacter sp. AP-Feld-500C-C5]